MRRQQTIWGIQVSRMYRLAIATTVGVSVVTSVTLSLGMLEAIAQVSAGRDRVGTRVNREVDAGREHFLIDGGTRSGDRQNLFHSFEAFGLTEHQIATFLSDPEVRNILSRVVGGNASIIDGLIEVAGSDANLYLLNPAGIVFGPNSQLNVSGDFTATTATGIGFENGWFGVGNDSDYAALIGEPTHFAFTADEPGSIINAGTLSVLQGSDLTLLGGTVVNTGMLTAPGGTVTIAAIPGDRLVRISQDGMLLNLEVTAFDERSDAVATGLPFTPLSLPQLLTGDEITSATDVTVNADGTVTLAGSGLSVPVQPGTAIASGVLDASRQMGTLEQTATVPQIHVLGDRVALIDATVDASSSTVPGLIQVGGGYQGNGTVPNAEHTYVDGRTLLRADGVPDELNPLSAVNGGHIITWADNTTQFHGAASAQGQGLGAEGGLVEISGSTSLTFDGAVDVSSAQGQDGTVLFDPIEILITDFSAADDNELNPNIPTPGDPAGAVFFDDAPMIPFTISPGAIATLSGTVRLQAHSDIIIESEIQSSTVDQLILQAGRSIIVEDVIDLTNGSFLARINDDGADVSYRGTGEAAFFMDSGEGTAEISTTNGDITIEVGTFGGSRVGVVEVINTTLQAQNGTISITGFGGTEGDGSNPGIVLNNSLVQSIGSGGVSLRGTSGGTFGDVSNAGVQILPGTVVEATGLGAIAIEGATGNAFTNNIGVEIRGSITASGGDISILGMSDNRGLGGFDNYGILLEGGIIKNTGTGSVTLEGTVGGGLSGTTNNVGIALLSGENVAGVSESSSIQVENGPLSLDGRTLANASGNYGILIGDGSRLLGNTAIRVTGNAPADAGIALDAGEIRAGTTAGSRITLTADTLDLINGARVEGAGRLTIQPLRRRQDIQLGGSEGTRFGPAVTDRLLVSNQDLSALADGFSQVTVGRANGSGQITVDGEVVLTDPTVVRSPTGQGSIDTTGGILRLANDAELSLTANRDLLTGDIIIGGRNLSVRSRNGAIDTTGGAIDAGSINGGGDVRFIAEQTLILGDVSTSSIASNSSDSSASLNASRAGNIRVTSSNGAVRLEGAVTAIADGEGEAGDGGQIRIQAAESIVATGSATLATFSRATQGNAGDGGPIRLLAGDTIRINPRLETFSRAESAGNSGRGGRIRLTAGRNISLENGANSSTVARQGTGGRGDIRLIADRAVTVNDILNTSASSDAGLSDSGGALRIRAGQDIRLNGLDTSAERVSPGGAIDIASANGTVQVSSAFPASSSANRSGGRVLAEGADGVRMLLLPMGDSSIRPAVTTSGERFFVLSENGPVTLTASDSMAIATGGGRIRLQGTEVTTRNIRLDSSAPSREGGAIALIAADGEIDVGDLDSSGQRAGDIRVQSSVAINTGSITASSTVGDGGNVLLDPPGDIEVDYVDARGGPGGEGGQVDVTTGRFFRVTGTVPETRPDESPSNRVQPPIDSPVSIITTGGLSSGSITIRHGGDGTVPFDVGNADVNGTAGAMISGNVQLIPFRSFPGIYREGSVSILTREPLRIEEEVSQQTVNEIDAPETSPDLPDITVAPPLAYLTPTASLETVETAATSEFTDYLGRSTTVPQITLAEAQASLQEIEQAAGIQPAILYAFFVPAPVSVQVTRVEGLENVSVAPYAPSYHSELDDGEDTHEYWIASMPSTMSVLPDLGDRPAHELNSAEERELWNFHDWNGAIAQAFSNNAPSDTDELELILLTSDTVVRRRIGGATRVRVQDVANEFRNHITSPRRSNAYLPASNALYQWMIEPLEADLQAQNIDNIAFVMDAGLRSLPIAALHDGQQFLIERFSVGLMPTLSLTDTRYADIRSMDVLAMGAEQFSDLPPLPAVPLELRAITENVWEGVAFMNDDFTVTNLQGERNDQPYGIVHLATHGEFQSGVPQNSYIQFGSQRLLLTELPSLSLNNPPVELLVLSACRTALGDRDAELGFAGLALQAGVKSALGSLWYISDTGTLALITEFYQALQDTTTKTDALRRAQLQLLHGTAQWREIVEGYAANTGDDEVLNISEQDAQLLHHPYYWSAFTIIGSPW